MPRLLLKAFDERIDPVGACVGVKGSRVHGIVRELCNENLDVINYSANTKLFIQRALAPAKVTSVNIDEENKKAEVFLKPEEVSLAIGRGGMNIKLASMLTEYTIDVFREVDENEADEDIYLDEFSDEIDQWVIDAIKGIGLDTAKQVLNAPRDYARLRRPTSRRRPLIMYSRCCAPNSNNNSLASECLQGI